MTAPYTNGSSPTPCGTGVSPVNGGTGVSPVDGGNGSRSPLPCAGSEVLKPRLRWYQGLTAYQWWVFIVAAMAWFFDCTDQRIFMLARSPALAELLNLPQTANHVVTYGTYATAATMVGWAVGGLFFGVMGDRWGRARTLCISVLVYSLFTGLCGLAQSGFDFCLYRFLMGGGIGGAFAAAATLVAETMPDHSRAFCLGLFSALSVIGNMSGAVLARWLWLPGSHYLHTAFDGGVSGWRLLFFLGAVPALLVVLILRTIRESDQWHAARRTASENLERQMGDVKGMFTDPRWRRNTLAAIGLATAGIVGVWGVGFWSPELIADALTPLALKGQKLPVAMAEHIDKVRAMGPLLQDVGGFLGILCFAICANRWGRRPVFAAAFVTSFASIAVTFLTLHSEWQAYLLLPIVGFFSLSVMGGLVVYLPELYPTRLRSTGTAFGYNVARLSAAIVMLLGNSIRSGLEAMHFANPFRTGAVVLSSIYVLGLFCLIWAPETRNQPLLED